MDQKEALSVLIQAVNMAQSKGVFNLQQASTVATAVSTFTAPPPENNSEKKEAVASAQTRNWSESHEG